MASRAYDARVASKRAPISSGSTAIVSRYRVGKHLVLVSKVEGRWSVTVDEALLPTWFMTQAEAWEAGVREADRLDRLGVA
jgi:hypothetical protein